MTDSRPVVWELFEGDQHHGPFASLEAAMMYVTLLEDETDFGGWVVKILPEAAGRPLSMLRLTLGKYQIRANSVDG